MAYKAMEKIVSYSLRGGEERGGGDNDTSTEIDRRFSVA